MPAPIARPRPARAAALALALLLAPAAGARAADDLPGSGGIRVNGALVSAEAVWREYRFQSTLRGFIHSKPAGQIDAAMFASVTRQLVNRELLEQEAARLGLRLTDADRAEARRRQVEGWKGELNFATAARMMGVPEQFIVDRASATLLRERMAEAAVPATPAATEEQLRAYHESHGAAYLLKDPPMRYVYILRKPGRRAPDLRLEMLVAADGLRQAGKGYASLVAQYSDHPGAAAGGAIPEGAPGRPPGLKPGRISEVVPDDAGWHFYLRDPEVAAPFEEVRARVVAEELQSRRNAWLAGVIEREAKKAAIEHLVGPPLLAPPAAAPADAGHGPGSTK